MREFNHSIVATVDSTDNPKDCLPYIIWNMMRFDPAQRCSLQQALDVLREVEKGYPLAKQ